MAFDNSSVSRSPVTEQSYRKRFKYKTQDVISMIDGRTPTLEDYVAYLELARRECSHNTFKTWRASFAFVFAERGESDARVAMLREVGYRKEDRIAYAQRLKEGRGTAASRKSKGITEKDLIGILSKLEKKRTVEDIEALDDYGIGMIDTINWTAYIYLFFKVNIHIGLRPVEYSDMEVIERHSEVVFRVRNRKNSNGRAHGEYRNIIIDRNLFGEQESEAIAARATILAAAARRYVSLNGEDKFYTNQANTWAEFRRTFIGHSTKRKKMITLYSTRHYFIASARKAGLNEVEIAALSGHASDRTASSHYGRIARKHGTGVVGVRADPDDVLNVRRSLEKARPKQAMKALRSKSRKTQSSSTPG